MTGKDKAALMRKLRQRRETEGLVQLNIWVNREDIERVRKYVARLLRNSGTGQ